MRDGVLVGGSLVNILYFVWCFLGLGYKVVCLEFLYECFWEFGCNWVLYGGGGGVGCQGDGCEDGCCVFVGF